MKANTNTQPEHYFEIYADPELVDRTNIDKLIQGQECMQRTESIQHTTEALGSLVGTSTLVLEAVGTRTKYALVNSERALRWLGHEILLDMTNQK